MSSLVVSYMACNTIKIFGLPPVPYSWRLSVGRIFHWHHTISEPGEVKPYGLMTCSTVAIKDDEKILNFLPARRHW